MTWLVTGKKMVIRAKPPDLVAAPDQAACARLSEHTEFVRQMANLESVEIGVGLAKPESSAVEVVERVQVFVPLEGVIDMEAERARLKSRMEQAERQLAVSEKKLSNENFVRKAPADIVERERNRKSELLAHLETLRKNFADLEEK